MSFDVDPVRLGPSRRRFEPVVIGVLAVVIALAVAVIKGWETSPTARTTEPSGAASSPTASIAPWPSAPPNGVQLAAAHAPTWSEVQPIVKPHDSWGIRVIMAGPGGSNGTPGTPGFDESWSPAKTAPDGTMIVSVSRDERSIAVLGVTSPVDAVAAAARIWRIHRDGQLEWVDAVGILSGDVNGSLLYVRPGVGGAPFEAWGAGDYRIDVLVRDGIRRLEIVVPNELGVVPPADDLGPSPVAPGEAAASDLSGVPVGLFATRDGVGVPLVTLAYRPLTEFEAWNDVVLYGWSHVAALALPRANGLGVMLAPGSTVTSASFARLAPSGGPFDAPPPIEGATEHPTRAPYVLFAAPDGGTWRPRGLCHHRDLER